MLRPCPNLQFLPFLTSSSAIAHRLPHRNLCPGPFGLHMTLTRRSDSPMPQSPFTFLCQLWTLGFVYSVRFLDPGLSSKPTKA